MIMNKHIQQGLAMYSAMNMNLHPKPVSMWEKLKKKLKLTVKEDSNWSAAFQPKFTESKSNLQFKYCYFGNQLFSK